MSVTYWVPRTGVVGDALYLLHFTAEFDTHIPERAQRSAGVRRQRWPFDVICFISDQLKGAYFLRTVYMAAN